MSIPIRDKKTDISSEVAKGEILQKKIIKLAKEAAEASINGTSLNEVIASIAKREGFNRLQIQRLVEEGNTVAYNLRYDKLRSSNDRRITFPIASLDGVISEMGFSAPPAIVNPNLPTGGQGGGEIAKAASTAIEPSPIHSPHANLDKRKQVYMDKIASVEKKQEEKSLARSAKETESLIFKIANSLVMTQRKFQNANQVYNTLIPEADLSESSQEAIEKKASKIADHMVKSNRSKKGFMVTLSHNSEEKIADHVLGEYSLLKQAEDSIKVKEVKIQPTADVTDFNQLIALAKKLEAQQNMITTAKQPGTTGNEVN